MTPTDWLARLSVPELQAELEPLPDRQLHRLTAAYLRRVWDLFPSEHTRLAVEETERFIDGRTTAAELARVRSTDLLETCEGLWLGPDESYYDDWWVGDWSCPCCATGAREYIERQGYVLDGAVSGVREPSWVAAQAAFVARELVGWAAAPGEVDATTAAEALAQHDIILELTGGHEFPVRADPVWLTDTVRALAVGIDRDRAYDRLPVLADALDDAGCTNALVLDHCRRRDGHRPGCWVVELFLSPP